MSMHGILSILNYECKSLSFNDYNDLENPFEVSVFFLSAQVL